MGKPTQRTNPASMSALAIYHSWRKIARGFRLEGDHPRKRVHKRKTAGVLQLLARATGL